MKTWLVAVVAAVGLSLLATRSARADWPMFGHDVGRTALAPAGGSITRPVPAWRHFLGGDVSSGSVRTLDVDGHEDLYVPIYWCGSPGNTEQRDAAAFSFRGGGTLDAPKKLFDIHRDTNLEWTCGSSDVLADVDGDGALEAIRFSQTFLWVYST